MKRRSFFRNIGLASAGLLVPAETILAQEVPLDTNIKGLVTANGKGIVGVHVSDGFSIVTTDKKGKYQLTLHPKAKFVFVCLPSGYKIQHKNGIAQFYLPVLEIENSTANFTLEVNQDDESKYSFIVWADPQIRTREDADKLLQIAAPDTVKHINSMPTKPLFGIGCGDLIWDKQELFADYKQAVATTQIPFWQVIGNHDLEFKTRSDEGSAVAFENHFGPTYYAFNKGEIHYVVLDDVFFIGKDRKYIGYLPEEQLSWLERDLATVAKGTTVVIALHIPTKTGITEREGLKEEALGGSLMNREALYSIVADFNVHFISGHTHFNEVWEQENMTEHVLGTLCGAWWTGSFCGDGTPAGFAVFEVNNDELSWYYKATGHEKEHQFTINPVGSSAQFPDAFVVNVWNCDAYWSVEWFENNEPQGDMERVVGYDPKAYNAYFGPTLPEKRKWVEPTATNHLFIAKPKFANSEITVKVTDRFGNLYQQRFIQ